MKQSVNPNMIILARESRGWTQSELARKLDIDQAIISRMEAGLISISDTMVSKLSEYLKYPENYFFDPANIYPLGIHLYRKAKGITQKELTIIKAKTNIDRIRMENLTRSAEFKVKDIPVCEIDGEHYKQPEDIARAIRLSWSIPSGKIENVTRLLEDAGIFIIFCDFESRQYDASSVLTENGKFIVFVNSNKPGDRIRFSLAHELGHIVMHRLPNENAEEEANRFASEFLMPEEDIKHQLNNLTLEKLANLKKYWKVSMQAILKRAETLNKISNRQYHYMWMQMGKLGYRFNEPSILAVPQETPTLLQETVNMYLTSFGFSPDELKKFLYTDDEDYKRFNSNHTESLRVISKIHKLNTTQNL